MRFFSASFSGATPSLRGFGPSGNCAWCTQNSIDRCNRLSLVSMLLLTVLLRRKRLFQSSEVFDVPQVVGVHGQTLISFIDDAAYFVSYFAALIRTSPLHLYACLIYSVHPKAKSDVSSGRRSHPGSSATQVYQRTG